MTTKPDLATVAHYIEQATLQGYATAYLSAEFVQLLLPYSDYCKAHNLPELTFREYRIGYGLCMIELPKGLHFTSEQAEQIAQFAIEANVLHATNTGNLKALKASLEGGVLPNGHRTWSHYSSHHVKKEAGLSFLKKSAGLIRSSSLSLV